MEPILRPWLETLDRLLPAAERSPHGFTGHAPRWRLQLYGGDAGSAVSKGHERPERAYIDLVQEIPPRDQRRLREAVELVALALRVDGTAFMAALARGMPWVTRAWTHEPFADGEKLQLRLPVDSRSYDDTFFAAFLEPLSDATASAEFKDAKRKLLALGGAWKQLDAPADFHLQVQLEIVPQHHNPAKMTEMLRRIDRVVFEVTKVYVILTTELETAEMAELVELYRAIHAFRDSAEVETHFDVPAAFMDRTKQLRWKWFFDLTARKTYGPSKDGTSAHPWIVAAMFGRPSLDRSSRTKATSAVAYLSALAHAGSHTTTATFVLPLQDPGNDRAVRAKYLGYLLRTRTLQKISFRDVDLTREDVANIRAVYNKPSQEEALRALYYAPWHARKGSVLDDKNAKKYLANTSEVVGVMNDRTTTSGGDTVDVFLAGFGQCGVKRTLLSEAQATRDTDATRPEVMRALKALDLLFLNGEQTVQSIVRLATTVGRSLEELRIENEEGAFQVMSLFLIFEACRRLRKLSIKQVALTPRDDEIPFTAPGPREHALEVLSVELQPTEESCGLAGLAKLLGNYGSGLKELELVPTDRELYEPFNEIVPVLHEMFAHRMPVLRKLRVRSFNSEYIQALWDRERPGLRELDVLILECVAWAKDHWTKFIEALSDPSHPLTQSVRTLHLQLNGWEKMGELQAMLRKNKYLSNVAVDFPEGLRTSSKLIQDLQATNGRAVYHLKAPLSVSQKAAFVSAVSAPLETQNLRTIVDYAASTETRYVRVSLASSRADH